MISQKIYNRKNHQICHDSIILKLPWIWLGFGLIPLLWAEDSFVAVIEILRMTRICFTLLLLSMMIKSKNDWLFVIYFFVISCAVQAVLIALQFISGSNLIRLPGGTHELEIVEGAVGAVQFFRPGGTLGHSSHYAKFATLVAPIDLVLLQVLKKPMQKLFFGICFVLILFSLIITMSRAGILSCCFGLLIMSILFNLSSRRKKNIIFSGIFLIIAFSVAWQVGGERVMSRFHYDSNSAESRIPQWITAGKLIMHYPQGVGLNNYVNVAVQYDSTGFLQGFPFPVHNIFLLYFSEIGLVGGTVFILMLSVPVLKSFKLSKHANNELDKFLLISIGVGMISSWSQGLTGWGHRSSELHFLCFAILSALIVVYENIIQNTKQA